MPFPPRPPHSLVPAGFIVAEKQVRKRLLPPGSLPTPSMATAMGQPRLMELHDLSPKGEMLQAHFNPSDLKKTVKVHWNEIVIPGMSHARLQYRNTDNLRLAFELYFDALQVIQSVGKGGKTSNVVRGESGPQGILRAERFLESLCYSKRGSATVASNAPPRVLFYWPDFLSLVCVIDSLDFTYTKFAAGGAPLAFTVQVGIREIRNARLHSEDVLEGGKRRSAEVPKPVGALRPDRERDIRNLSFGSK